MEDVVTNEVEETLEETTDNDPVVEEELEELTDATEEEHEEENEISETEEIDESEEKEEVVENEEKPTYTKTKVQSMVKDRLKRERQRVQPLIDVLRAGGFEGESIDELTQEIANSYKEQGIDVAVPSRNDNLTDKEARALAQLDAEEVIALGEEAMEERFIELYNKEDRTLREENEMSLIGKEASMMNAKKEFVEMGLNPEEIMNNKEFVDFASKFNPDVSLNEIYKMFRKYSGNAPAKPKSTGSIKSKGTSNKIKSFYSYEEAKKFTEKDYDNNPGLLEAVENSMSKW